VDSGILGSLVLQLPGFCLVRFAGLGGQVISAAFGCLELACLGLLLLRGAVRLLLSETLVKSVSLILRGRIDAARPRYVHLLALVTLDFGGIGLLGSDHDIAVGWNIIPR
jgi:hypothetical protein